MEAWLRVILDSTFHWGKEAQDAKGHGLAAAGHVGKENERIRRKGQGFLGRVKSGDDYII